MQFYVYLFWLVLTRTCLIEKLALNSQLKSANSFVDRNISFWCGLSYYVYAQNLNKKSN